MGRQGDWRNDYTVWRAEMKSGASAEVIGGSRILRRLLIPALLCGSGLSYLPTCAAQEAQGAGSSKPDAPAASDAKGAVKPKDTERKDEHQFWDKENDWLFAGVGASRTLDYFSTLNMRRRGRQEILLTNDVVDNHAAFATIEAAATGVSIGASYLFHRYDHHKLERWTSIIHIGVATTGAVRNYCLKTAHYIPAPALL
jgi:hypothetical protein